MQPSRVAGQGRIFHGSWISGWSGSSGRYCAGSDAACWIFLHARAEQLLYGDYPAGERWAAVLWGSVRIYGWLGWALREAADWVGYHDVQPWWKASELFLAEAESEEACPICGTSKSNPNPEETT